MDKLTDDIEIKRKLLNKLREEVSDAEKSKIVKNSLRTSFPTVSTEVNGMSCISVVLWQLVMCAVLCKLFQVYIQLQED